MISKIKKLFSNESVRYLFVGGVNTIFGWILTYLFSVPLRMNFTLTSVLCFIIGGAFSYIMNRGFTFHATQLPVRQTLPRFALNLGICYVIAYLVLQPLIHRIVDAAALPWPQEYQTLVKLLIANLIFIVINYIGQKYFAFRKANESPETEQNN